ncbi:MAG: phosphoribosyltransferase [Spirochaetota bacterium]
MFKDRRDAGARLAVELSGFAGRVDVITLGLPRGGVPVAFEVARSLEVSLDVFLVRKLGVPGNPELAMGAVASGGIRVLNQEIVGALGIPEQAVEEATAREMEELRRREREFRGERPFPDVEGHTLLLIDDGLATGASMRAALKALETRGPARVVVAVPTAPHEVCDSFRREHVDVYCLENPVPFYGVGGSYENFEQQSDQEVKDLLEEYRRLSGGSERA